MTDRPLRKVTTIGIVHRIGDVERGPVGLSIDSAKRFFLSDPEGVATVTLGGSWADRLKVFSTWWLFHRVPSSWHYTLGGHPYPRPEYRSRIPTDIPANRLAKAHVPYHHVIGMSDEAACLPSGAIGNHTAGWNTESVAIAVVRPSGASGPLPPEQERLLRQRMMRVSIEYPEIKEWIGHDVADRRKGRAHGKNCPGLNVSPLSSWALLAADHVRQGIPRL